MKKYLLGAGAFLGASVPAFADVTGSYDVPSGVQQAVADAKVAATSLANEAIPAVAAIALAFVGIAVIWLLVKSIRRGAK